MISQYQGRWLCRRSQWDDPQMLRRVWNSLANHEGQLEISRSDASRQREVWAACGRAGDLSMFKRGAVEILAKSQPLICYAAPPPFPSHNPALGHTVTRYLASRKREKKGLSFLVPVSLNLICLAEGRASETDDSNRCRAEEAGHVIPLELGMYSRPWRRVVDYAKCPWWQDHFLDWKLVRCCTQSVIVLSSRAP